MSLAIAIIPSNQETNTSKVKPEYNEYGGMKYLCTLLERELRNRGVEAYLVPIASEKNDTYELQGLIEAMKYANTVLAASSAINKYIISFHTDSGKDYSHTFGISDGTQDGWEAAAILAAVTTGCLDTEECQVFSQHGGVDYTEYIFAKNARYTSALIELCSHESDSDMGSLWLRSHELARQLALGMLTFPVGIGETLLYIEEGLANALEMLRGD